jgi:hypothetical protein
MPGLSERNDLARDVVLLVGAGLFLAVVGPFGSITANPLTRFLYWPGVIVGGGVIGISVDELGGRRFANPWTRWAFDSVVMTPGVCVLVAFASRWAFGPFPVRQVFSGLIWQVFVISVAVMGVRQLVQLRRSPPPAATPQPDAAFRKRLSAKRREARLIAVKAEDHYLRVFTDAGEELITARFADALAELAAAPGFRTHRSWWVAASAIEGVRWRRGAGEARLSCDLVAPVSRGEAPALKRAGWR